MNIHDLKAYEVIGEKNIEDIHSYAYILRHKKSGARIAVLSNDDDNKVFTIGFRTPPEDSTGTPHILEHSVLCGSRNFPVKDPFIELAKGSMNTFLNAMTYPDKTLYPVASCNDKDFQNLMHIYLDAVFFTKIYDQEEIFRQEGWHFELESPAGPLKYNGVVYNEMKGAFSSPESVLDRVTLNSLFPDTPYAYESGGNPSDIPKLSYSKFLSFHSKYYHPSNSYIYLYGDMDAAKKLDWIDREYLSKYDAFPVESEIKGQEPFKRPVEVKKKYSIGSNESEKDNTYLAYNTVIDTCLNRELYLAFEIIDYALFSAPGAPVRQALLDAKIGKDVMSNFENGVYQPYFTIAVKNANEEDRDKFLRVVEKTLRDLVEHGIDHSALKAGLNLFEFQYREADFGSYPKGLMYGLQMFDSWLYDDLKPFIHLEALDTFAFLRKMIGTSYYEKLVEKYLIQNTHASLVIIEPEKGLTGRMEKRLEEKLETFRKGLDAEQLKKLVESTESLHKYQMEPSTEEELRTIPVLKREDIPRKVRPFSNREVYAGNTLMLHHEMFTNGIGYLTLLFDTKKVPEELIPYLGILKNVLGNVDTANYKYGDLCHAINSRTGGIWPGMEVFSDVRNVKNYRTMFEMKAKVLYEELPFAFEMIEEIICHSKFEDEKRIYEIIAQMKSRLQSSMTSRGDLTAAVRSLSYISEISYLKDLTGGIRCYRLLNELEKHFDQHKDALIRNLNLLMTYIFKEENMMVSYTADEKGFGYLAPQVELFKQKLHHEDLGDRPYMIRCQGKNEGFLSASKVQYVAQSGNFLEAGFSYSGTMSLLKVILNYDYLWNHVRVQGGAYGCMSGFGRTGDVYFTSYRDPNLERTLKIYGKVVDYIHKFQVDDRTMNQYIIGAIGDLDIPMNPSTLGERSLSAYLSHVTEEQLLKERLEILDATDADIRALAPVVDAVLKYNNICVIGSEEKVKEQRHLFESIEDLV